MSYLSQWAESRNGQTAHLFPKEASNIITLFPRFRDPLTGNETNVTVFLNNSIWNENSIEVQNKTGALGTNRQIKISARVPYLSKYSGRKYVSAARWQKLAIDELDQYWTINPRQLPLACNGKFEYYFPWGTSAQIVSLENAIMTINSTTFNPNARRLIDINEILLGIFPDLTEDENYEQYPEKFKDMGNMWQIAMQA